MKTLCSFLTFHLGVPLSISHGGTICVLRYSWGKLWDVGTGGDLKVAGLANNFLELKSQGQVGSYYVEIHVKHNKIIS